MTRTYSITDSLFGDGCTVHASQLVGDMRISVSCVAATLDEARRLADRDLDDAVAALEKPHG